MPTYLAGRTGTKLFLAPKTMTTDLLPIEMQLAPQSRIREVDFNNLPFGKHFADHMFVADYNGTDWTDLRVVPFGDFSFNPALSSLHYGQSIFEGMKAYKNDAGEVLTFRPLENWARMNESATRMCMADSFILAQFSSGRKVSTSPASFL